MGERKRRSVGPTAEGKSRRRRMRNPPCPPGCVYFFVLVCCGSYDFLLCSLFLEGQGRKVRSHRKSHQDWEIERCKLMVSSRARSTHAISALLLLCCLAIFAPVESRLNEPKYQYVVPCLTLSSNHSFDWH